MPEGDEGMNYLERLRGFREDAELSQESIARMLNVAQNTYSQYERNKRAMPIECLIALCKFYGVSADYVLGLSTEKYIQNPTAKK